MQIRLTRYKMFALEMAKECLRHESIPKGYHVRGMFTGVDMEDIHLGDTRVTEVLIKIYGASTRPKVVFYPGQPNEDWGKGRCAITLPACDSRTWVFEGEIVGNHVEVTLVEMIEAPFYPFDPIL